MHLERCRRTGFYHRGRTYAFENAQADHQNEQTLDQQFKPPATASAPAMIGRDIAVAHASCSAPASDCGNGGSHAKQRPGEISQVCANRALSLATAPSCSSSAHREESVCAIPPP